MTILLRLPIKLESEANAHAHFRARQQRARLQREAVAAALRAHRPPPLPCVVVVMRVAPRALDSDNLVGSAKHVRDQVAEWLGVDDRDPRVTWHVSQGRGLRGQYEARIHVRGRCRADDEYDAIRRKVVEVAA